MEKVDALFATHGPMDAKQWGRFEIQPEKKIFLKNRTKSLGAYSLPGKIEIESENYPFTGFVGKKSSLLQLEYLLGAGCVRGGCILVTGCRGAGKTTLVNRAIYEAGLLVPLGESPYPVV